MVPRAWVVWAGYGLKGLMPPMCCDVFGRLVLLCKHSVELDFLSLMLAPYDFIKNLRCNLVKYLACLTVKRLRHMF